MFLTHVRSLNHSNTVLTPHLRMPKRDGGIDLLRSMCNFFEPEKDEVIKKRVGI